MLPWCGRRNALRCSALRLHPIVEQYPQSRVVTHQRREVGILGNHRAAGTHGHARRQRVVDQLGPIERGGDAAAASGSFPRDGTGASSGGAKS